MIFDTLAAAARYEAVHPLLAKAFEAMRKLTPEALPEGKLEIEGRSLYVVPFRDEKGLTREAAKMESHRRYVDIHYLLAGQEEIGWKPEDQCSNVTRPFIEEKDCILYGDAAEAWVTLHPGQFLAVWPGEVHAARVSAQGFVKVVVKLLV